MTDDRRWFSETLIRGMRLSLEAREVLLHEQSDGREVVLFDHEVFGRVLMIDGAVQLTTRDEFAYHEMMAHVPILAHGAAHEVLIVGGGDCGLAEEVLKHRSVRRVEQVEIDPLVVEIARRHLAEINAAALRDPRFHLVIGDGAELVGRRAERYDVILVDSTDPVGPGARLFTAEFYRSARSSLKTGGVLVTQNGVPFLQGEEFSRAFAALAGTFRHVSSFVTAVPTYFGGHLALGWASDDLPPPGAPAETLAERFAAAQLRTGYYTPEVHRAAFVLPRYVRDALERARGTRQAD